MGNFGIINYSITLEQGDSHLNNLHLHQILKNAQRNKGNIVFGMANNTRKSFSNVPWSYR